MVDEKEAAIIEEQVRLLEELNENRRRVERERKPLAEKREREMTLDIERTRRIEQNNVCVKDLIVFALSNLSDTLRL